VDLDIHGYDFIIDNGSTLHKVQVKGSGNKQNNDRYKIICGRGISSKKEYSEDAFDYLVIVLFANKEHFYVIPRSEIKALTMNLYPHKKTLQNPHKVGKWEKYKDNNLTLLKG
jgi:hypothetical protein